MNTETLRQRLKRVASPLQTNRVSSPSLLEERGSIAQIVRDQGVIIVVAGLVLTYMSILLSVNKTKFTNPLTVALFTVSLVWLIAITTFACYVSMMAGGWAPRETKVIIFFLLWVPSILSTLGIFLE